MKRLAIITSHPIQYNAPLFKLLTERKLISLKVFYTWGSSVLENKFDPGFGKIIKWDIPLLDGYDFTFVRNVATDPGTHHFKGIINPSLCKEVEKWEPDAILIYGWSFNSHLKCLRYFHNKLPVYFRGDSTLQDEYRGLKKIIRTFILTWVYRHIDIALYVGTENKKYYLRHKVKKSQLIFAPHAVENIRFMDSENQLAMLAQDWRNRMNIPDDAIVFLFSGKFEQKKNPFLLLQAFEKIESEDVWLIMVGNGILETQLKQMAEGNSRIIFIDFQNQSLMPVTYRLGNIFILPSKGPGETWGLSVNEAMASERAILVSNKCGCAIDLVKEGINGYVFKNNDKDDLVEKMKLFIARKGQVTSMGKASLETIRQWSYQKVSEALEKTLNT